MTAAGREGCHGAALVLVLVLVTAQCIRRLLAGRAPWLPLAPAPGCCSYLNLSWGWGWGWGWGQGQGLGLCLTSGGKLDLYGG